MPAERPRPTDVLVRGMWPQDWPAVARIYALGLAEGTLETRVPDREAFEAARPEPLRLVAVDGSVDGRVNGSVAGSFAGASKVLGWAAATPVSSRPVYAGVVEHSVYVDPDARGRGVGRALLSAFVTATEVHGFWSIRSGLFPENTASRALHAGCGFREVGRYDRPGRRDGVWRDVVVIERRSRTVGLDGEPLVRLARPGDPGLPAAVRTDTAWRTWVADAEATGGVLLGRAALERAGTAEAPAYLLRTLAVEPPHRGRGLGRRLLTTALAAAGLDAPGPALVALPASAGAATAARLGFRPLGHAEIIPDGLPGAGYVRTVGG